jgi:hypothetical protein
MHGLKVLGGKVKLIKYAELPPLWSGDEKRLADNTLSTPKRLINVESQIPF